MNRASVRRSSCTRSGRRRDDRCRPRLRSCCSALAARERGRSAAATTIRSGARRLELRRRLQPRGDVAVPSARCRSKWTISAATADGSAPVARVGCRWIVNASLHACNDKQDGDAVVCDRRHRADLPARRASWSVAFSRQTTRSALRTSTFRWSTRPVPTSHPSMPRVAVTVTTRAADTTTTTDPDNPAVAYDVVFDMAETAGPVGALQLDITHPGAAGGWLAVRQHSRLPLVAHDAAQGCNKTRTDCSNVQLSTRRDSKARSHFSSAASRAPIRSSSPATSPSTSSTLPLPTCLRSRSPFLCRASRRGRARARSDA